MPAKTERPPHVEGIWALGTLIEGAKAIEQILFKTDEGKWDRHEHSIDIPRHPFGLEIPERSSLRIHREIAWCGHPSYTDSSVKTFLAHILDHISANAAMDSLVGYMRKILVEVDPKRPNQHDVYFEIMLGSEVYMCGGCTDCSGKGSEGNRQVSQVFGVISKMTDVPVNEVTIPFGRGNPAREALIRFYNNVRRS